MNAEKPKFHKAVFEKAITFMLAGFSFVAALAWNDAIQTLFHQVFGTTPQSFVAKFMYAVIITAIATFLAIRLSRDIGSK